MEKCFLFFIFPLFFISCSQNSFRSIPKESLQNSSGITDPQPPNLPQTEFLSEEKIRLDEFGENFQNQHAEALLSSRYMEKSCANYLSTNMWKGLPLILCNYKTDGQTAKVLMLNPGPRRLTLWLEDACRELSKNFSDCMEKSFKQILYQSGGQFPISGVVIEDMDGDGRGNAYAFRNGVTVQIPTFGTGTGNILSPLQIAQAFLAPVIKTYTYARPISLTREELTDYALHFHLEIPEIGSSSEKLNAFHEVVGDLYQKAWRSHQNHLMRAWVYNQNF